MKRITLITLAITAILFGSVSCQKDNIKAVEPIVPQGEVTREFLSRIHVGKDGHFQYWNQDSPALKELKVQQELQAVEIILSRNQDKKR